MNLREARAALRSRVPVQTCGHIDAALYGKIKNLRVLRISENCGKYGDIYFTADVAEESNGRSVNVLTCGIENIEIADEAPETLKALFERWHQKIGAGDRK